AAASRSPQSQWLVPLSAAAAWPASTRDITERASAEAPLAAAPVTTASPSACSQVFTSYLLQERRDAIGATIVMTGRNGHACGALGSHVAPPLQPRPSPALDPRPSHQAAPLPPLVGAALLLLVATAFASNHIAARLAFDHGTSVATAVATRSITTVVVVLALLLASGASLRPPAGTLRRALLVGVLLSVQSYCLYAAVARLPVALALLTFNVFPILLALVAWVAGGQRPGRRTLLAMPVILLGLALALDVVGAGARPVAGSRAAGIAFALAASSTFAVALYLTTRWLGAMDGRLRAVLTMATVAVVVLALGGLVDLLGLATDAAG